MSKEAIPKKGDKVKIIRVPNGAYTNNLLIEKRKSLIGSTGTVIKSNSKNDFTIEVEGHPPLRYSIDDFEVTESYAPNATRNVPLIVDVEKAAEAKYGKDPNLYGAQRDGFIAGANYERSKLPELIAEVLKLAADHAIAYANTPTMHGNDRLREVIKNECATVFVDKQSILNINCDDLIK